MKKKSYISLIFCILTLSLFVADFKTVFSLSPQITINNDKDGAPSPIKFGVGIGFEIPLIQNLLIAPQFTFSTNYYLVANNKVLPAEIENRTALAPSLMFDIPFGYKFYTKNFSITPKIGAGTFLRYGFLAFGVSKNESDLVDFINEGFYKDLAWLYPLAEIDFDFVVKEKLTAGFGIKYYLPLGSVLKGETLQNSIFALQFRFAF